MRRIVFFLLMILLLIFAGCGNKDKSKYSFVFQGGSKDWVGVARYDITEKFTKKEGVLNYKNEENKCIKVIYRHKLSDLLNAKKISIAYKSNSKSGKLSEEIDKTLKSKIFTIKGGCKNTTIIRKDETIRVTVTLDGKKQTFQLKRLSGMKLISYNLRHLI